MAKTRPQHTAAVRKDPGTWLCIAILTGLPLLFFRDILLGNAFLWEDFLYLTYPIRKFAATSLAMGQIPLWNPYIFSGMPFLADLNTTVLYIPCTLLTLVVRDGSLPVFWVELLTVLHYVLAGVTMFALAQSYGLRRGPALFSGAAYMLSGFMIVHAIHLPVISMFAWFPLVFLFFRNVLLHEEWWRVFLCAVVLGHTWLAGFPQLSLYLYVFLVASFLFEVFRHSLLTKATLKMVARAAAVIALSLAVSMVQFLPAQEIAELSKRAEMTYGKAAEGSLAWQQLLTLFFPKFFGTAGAQGYPYWGPGAYWYFWETCIYVGILPCILMLLSIPFASRRREVLFFLGTAFVALLYALGDNFVLHRLMFDFVPGFSRFRVPGRAVMFLPFSASLLSGFALQGFMHEELTPILRTRITRLLAGAGGLGLLLWLLLATGALEGTFRFLSNPQASAIVHRDATVSGCVISLSILVLYYFIRRKAWNRAAIFVLVGLFFIDMALFGGNQNNGKVNPEEYFKQPQRLLTFLKTEAETEIFRINSRSPHGMILDRNQGMFSRIFTMEGYTPLALQRLSIPVADSVLFDLLNVKYKTVINEKTRVATLEPHPTYLPRAFFLYAYHVAREELELVAYMNSPAFNHRTTAVLEKDPGVTLAADTAGRRWIARIREYSENAFTLDVETDHDGLLLLSEMYYPGWKAFVDGKQTEIFRTDYSLRSLFVPAGKHDIVVKYQPDSVLRGGLISLGSLLLCIIGGVASFIAYHRRRSGVSPAKDVHHP